MARAGNGGEAGGRRPRKAAAETGPRQPRRTAKQRRREEAARGAIEARAARLDPLPGELQPLCEAIAGDGGAVLGAFRDPLSARPLLLAALPLDRVAPTPYQRTVSPAHVERLADAITRTGAYLDPIIAFREPTGDGAPYHTPNGGHRVQAMRRMGARAITALVVPDATIAWRILALNTEKAHNLKERALEVARMARALADLPGREIDFAPYFEDPSLLTVGLAYEGNGRLAGAAWHPIVKRLEAFTEAPLAEAVAAKRAHAEQLLALDERVTQIVEALKARGLQSPWLRQFVIARLNPLRFAPRGKPKDDEPSALDFDATFDKMRRAAERFDASRVDPGDLAHTGGPVEEAAE